MQEKEFNAIRNEFLDIYTAIKELSDEDILDGPEDIFQPHFERLQRFIATDIDDHAADKALCDRKLRAVIKHIAHLKTINGLRMEIKYAQSIVAGPNPWALVKRFPFYPNYLKLAGMEYEGANLTPEDRVVFLGSGPLPLSLISLYKQFGVKGVGIEKVPEYAELSAKLIEALDLSAHIRIVQGNHFSLPLQAECRLVMVGADARPKDEIFAHLNTVLGKGAWLSYRIYEKGLRRLMDEQPAFDMPSELKEYTRIRPEPPVNNTSVFLIKTDK